MDGGKPKGHAKGAALLALGAVAKAACRGALLASSTISQCASPPVLLLPGAPSVVREARAETEDGVEAAEEVLDVDGHEDGGVDGTLRP